MVARESDRNAPFLQKISKTFARVVAHAIAIVSQAAAIIGTIVAIVEHCIAGDIPSRRGCHEFHRCLFGGGPVNAPSFGNRKVPAPALSENPAR
jgi:hypothetical protein